MQPRERGRTQETVDAEGPGLGRSSPALEGWDGAQPWAAPSASTEPRRPAERTLCAWPRRSTDPQYEGQVSRWRVVASEREVDPLARPWRAGQPPSRLGWSARPVVAFRAPSEAPSCPHVFANAKPRARRAREEGEGGDALDPRARLRPALLFAR